ncbi:N-acetylmuramic acid 6-phosphate etherase [Halanaerobacter jeridensis]|uniref:N-acetylmuramic acid 6-phosphate etherase n=1 Tax=Halanaerobacter jeridensis TaxID=706427 RepID=A0A938XZJ4_9FIRM|nr:N-acetylmuramic acid 6-phosphate etherase [Halanaerobacter jeridensis]MBM7558210.1 N-acetylmuramic acid 6-phosphate etherase [Halanaerobacter jeridensis]
MLTKERNQDTLDIDKLDSLGIINKINNEDKKVALAVEKEKKNIAQAVDLIVNSLKNDGRLFYVGSGTSGKLGVMDASECPPTFGVKDSLVQGIISGGEEALSGWLEGTEDDQELAVNDLKEKNLTEQDVVVAITASGNTPYAIAAIEYAKQIGATNIALICNPEGELKNNCEQCICVDVGPEVIMGSTRMKAGTAQKMVLNMLSTASMIKLGKVYSNLMINVQPINKKLKRRVEKIVQLATDADEESILEVLEKCDYDAKLAIVMIEKECGVQEAKKFIKEKNGIINQSVL